MLRRRAQQQRNLLATLFLSQGVPMLLMGDELGRTQNGNNNAYCQDNEISWVNWSSIDQALLEYVRWLIAFRRSHPSFRRRRWFQGRPIRGALDIAWLKPDGKPMTDQDWTSRQARSLGVYLDGRAIPGHDEHGRPITDQSFSLLFNGQARAVYWTLPDGRGQGSKLLLDTERLQPEPEPQPPPGRVLTRARAVVILESHTTDGG